MVKYYSTQRPIGPGTFPSGKKVEEITNFDRRSFVVEIGREAWGYIVFNEPLEGKEAKAYELVRAPH